MLTFLFWNLAGKALQDRIARIAHSEHVDVVMLAECEIPPDDVLNALNAVHGHQYAMVPTLVGELAMFSRLSQDRIRNVADDNGLRLTIKRVFPESSPDFLLAIVHLRSKLFASGSHQDMVSGLLHRRISFLEDQVGHRRTVLVGDMNMNPFENGMVAADRLHSVMSKEVALRGSRYVHDQECRFFYNPMWGCLGDQSHGPAGSYYRSAADAREYFWHMYDQVLFRPSLLSHFNDQVRILASDGTSSLLNRNSIPDKSRGSDHLPLLFQLEM